MISAYLCWPACVFFVLHARQWVRRAPGIPCALCFRRDKDNAKPGRICAAGTRGRVNWELVQRPVDRLGFGDICYLRPSGRHHTFGGAVASSWFRRMSYELLAIAVPVVAIILMVIFGRAVRHFMIDAPSRSGQAKRLNRHCEERSDEAIHLSVRNMDASLHSKPSPRPRPNPLPAPSRRDRPPSATPS